MDTQAILPILKKIPLFEQLNETEHAEIIQHIKLQSFSANQLLFNEGDPGARMFIIKSGKVKIYHPIDPSHPIAELGRNDFFGEMALFRDDPRNASAMTVEDSELFVLEKSVFYDLVLKNPDMAQKLSEEFLERVKQNEAQKGL